jgi:hypothetical protein
MTIVNHCDISHILRPVIYNIIFLFTLNNFNFFHSKDDPSLLDILVNNHAVTVSVSVCMCVIHNPDIPE